MGGLQRTQQGSSTKMQTVRIASTHRLESLWRLVTPVELKSTRKKEPFTQAGTPIFPAARGSDLFFSVWALSWEHRSRGPGKPAEYPLLKPAISCLSVLDAIKVLSWDGSGYTRLLEAWTGVSLQHRDVGACARGLS